MIKYNIIKKINNKQGEIERKNREYGIQVIKVFSKDMINH